MNLASLTLLRHLSVSHPHKPSLYSNGRDPLTILSKNTSHKLLCPTAFTDLGTLLATSPFEEASKWLPSHLEGPYPGFGYPLYELLIPKPSRASLSSERSGLLPSELSSFSVIDRIVSNPTSPLRHFSIRHLSLIPVLQRFPPTEKAAPLSLPRRLIQGRAIALLGLTGLPGSLQIQSPSKVFSTSKVPSHS